MKKNLAVVGKNVIFSISRCPVTVSASFDVIARGSNPSNSGFFGRSVNIQGVQCNFCMMRSFGGVPLRQFLLPFSSLAAPILVRARDPSQLAVELMNAIDEGKLDIACRIYDQYLHMDGFPRKSVLSVLIVGLAESYDSHWLSKAYQLVESIFNKRKSELLEKDPLLYVAFLLSRYGLHVEASTMLRRLVEMAEFPPVTVWTVIIGQLAQTSEGALLAAELVLEFGYLFKDNRVDPRKKSNKPLLSMKPISETFHIALTGCLIFGLTKKGEQLIELMPRVGVRADGSLLIVMAQIFGKNGCIDELKKLKRHVNEANDIDVLQFRQFYDCLLSCHLKFNDLDSATGIVLEMLRRAKEAQKSLTAAKSVLNIMQNGCTDSSNGITQNQSNAAPQYFQKISDQHLSFKEFCKLKSSARFSYHVKDLLAYLSKEVGNQVKLVRSEHGILHPTEKLYAKLVRAFLDAGNITELANFLVKASKEEAPISNENSAIVQVINTLIHLELLEQAHDLLDEIRFNGIPVSSSVYCSLLKAYCKGNRILEITGLLKDAHKTGVQLDSSCYEALIQLRAHNQDISGALHLFNEMKGTGLKLKHLNREKLQVEFAGCDEASLMTELLEEIRDTREVNYGVHEWNSMIQFFCKKQLMVDAQKAFKKMRALGHFPNSQTFHSLVTAYAAIGGKYVEVTDLWGEMKLLHNSSSLEFDQELLDSLLYCFVRGGFFLRANEVINMMEARSMFVDKFKYRTLWLKYHRSLYKGKSPKIQTEAQHERREAALSFKKWLNIM